METKHTPGPWTLSDKTTIIGTMSGKPYSTVVAHTVGYKATREANARLIAAAPELLHALENTVNIICMGIMNGCWNNTSSDDQDSLDEVQSVVDTTRAAIAKAGR